MLRNALTERSRRTARDSLPTFSPWLYRLFGAYAERYLRRHFHGVRVSRSGASPRVDDGSVIIYLNHPSWWDPLVGLVLARRVLPNHRLFAPMDAAALERYQFFKRLGFFGIEKGTLRGARTFLRTAESILATPTSMLWITGQGEFTDARTRPVRLRSGLGHLAARLGGGTIVPLALEYPFWNERLPEALARFGQPLEIEHYGGFRPDEWTELLEAKLQQAQDKLAEEAAARDPLRFHTLIEGRRGVGGIYDLWRRLRSVARGQRFDPEHRA